MTRSMHPWALDKAEHWLAFDVRYLKGVRAVRAYFTRDRIYTETMCFDRKSGRLLYGRLHLSDESGVEQVLTAEDIRSIAWWGPGGWTHFDGAPRPDWDAPAYLPGLDQRRTARKLRS